MNNFFLLFQINYFYLLFCFSGQWGLYHELSVFDQKKKKKKAIPKPNCVFAIVYVFTLEIISFFCNWVISKTKQLIVLIPHVHYKFDTSDRVYSS